MAPARPFADRRGAGRRLALRLEGSSGERPIVFGMARGGVPVAAVVAEVLGAPLDALVVRKIGAPRQPEFAVGAIARGVVRFDEVTIERLGISRLTIAESVAREQVELERRERRYRAGRPELVLEGRVVILVDDGLATGLSALAGLEALRARRPSRLVFAAPVCAPESVSVVRQVAAEVVCVLAPSNFETVGQWYDDFSPTSDEEVVELLDRP